MRPDRKHGEPALGEHLASERAPGEHACPDDGAGGVRIPPDAPFDLLLQGQEGQHPRHQTGQTPLHLSGRAGQVAGIVPQNPARAKFREGERGPDRLAPPQARTQKLVGHGNDRQPYADTGGIDPLHRGVGRAGSGRLRAVARRAVGGRLRDRDTGQLQRLDREGQEQEDLQRRSPHRGGRDERHGAPLPRLLPRGEAGHSLHRHRAGPSPLPAGTAAHPAAGRTARGAGSRQPGDADAAQIPARYAAGHCRPCHRHYSPPRPGDYRWHPRPALRHQLAQGGDRHHLPFHAVDRRPADPHPHHPTPKQE